MSFEDRLMLNQNYESDLSVPVLRDGVGTLRRKITGSRLSRLHRAISLSLSW